MKIPLRYQISEYDCGPTTLLNGLSYLFEREEIPADIIRNIMLFSLDTYSSEGRPGAYGTSHVAMRFLSGWLNNAGEGGVLAIRTRYLTGMDVTISPDASSIVDCVERDGAAVVRCMDETWHYVLVTGYRDGMVQLFDPYYETETESDQAAGIRLVPRDPFRYNRMVPETLFNTTGNGHYALGPWEKREAVLLFNRKTEKQEKPAVEYVI